MSYDIWLEIDTGGEERARVANSINYTSNVRPMWDLALKGLPIEHVADMHERLAGDCVGPLRAAVETMKLDFEQFEALNPPNGWGNANGAREFLAELADMCAAHPKATVVIWR